MGKLFLLAAYFAIAPLFVLFAILYFSYLSFNQNKNISFPLFSQTKTVAYAALPTNQNIFNEEIAQVDGRVEMLRQFFAKYASPLEPYAKNIVSDADKYDLDFRLIPSIAMQESNLCKKIPSGSNNCWGFGIYGGKVTKFENYPQAIEIVTKTLAHDYKKSGLDTPEEIMKRYAPSSNGSWARGVNHFMDQLQ